MKQPLKLTAEQWRIYNRVRDRIVPVATIMQMESVYCDEELPRDAMLFRREG